MKQKYYFTVYIYENGEYLMFKSENQNDNDIKAKKYESEKGCIVKSFDRKYFSSQDALKVMKMKDEKFYDYYENNSIGMMSIIDYELKLIEMED